MLLKKQSFFLLFMLFILIPECLYAMDDKSKSSILSAPSSSAESVPQIYQIIPLSITLTTNLSVQTTYFNNDSLKNDMFSASIEKHSLIDEKIKSASQKFSSLQKKIDDNYLKYFVLRQSLIDYQTMLEQLNKPLAEEIKLLNNWKITWGDENIRWNSWRKHYIDEGSTQLLQTFVTAIETIDKGRSQIDQHLEPLLSLQSQNAMLQSKVNILNEEISYLIKEHNLESIFDRSPAIYSPLFFQQLKAHVTDPAWSTIGLGTWLDIKFTPKHGVVFLFSFLLILISSAVIKKNKKQLTESANWFFIGKKPISSVLFICSFISAIQFSLWGIPKAIILINSIVGGVSSAILIKCMFEQHWKGQAIYWIMVVYIVMVFLIVIGTPLPIFRLYVFISSNIGLVYCIKWIKENGTSAGKVVGSKLNYLMKIISALLAFVVVMELIGQDGIATYTFKTFVLTLAQIIIPSLLFIHLIKGAMSWFFTSSFIWQIKLMRSDASEYARKTAFFIQFLIIFFFLIPSVLSTWQLYPSLEEALSGMLKLGFYVGDNHISISLAVISLLTITTTIFISKVIPKILLDEYVSGKLIERGARNSIGHLLRYSIILVGFFVAVSMLGFDLTKITIILGALGVGIGFGLQGIVNNFVCGLVLLFERPIREGDTVSISDGLSMGIIKKIGLRSTVLQTFDNAEVIIPNADLISNQVTNWTLQNREARLSVPVSVAYGCDVALVDSILVDCAKSHPKILKSPAPYTLFMELGDSSLNFELRAWIPDADDRLSVRSELYYDIVKRFSEANIEIPFPQRDLHIRSIDMGTISNIP
ncbi:mechanosensitive ion channel family protein [Shewanella marisflavi]|uniref:mechanosensitive ion channel family protein n=1 Tax=Shewanella marisflavi TaxID=260364 RepID=UPI003AABAB90